MTDEESKKDAMTFFYGFEKGQTHERHQIVAWIRVQCENGAAQGFTAQARAISTFADAIERGDYKESAT